MVCPLMSMLGHQKSNVSGQFAITRPLRDKRPFGKKHGDTMTLGGEAHGARDFHRISVLIWCRLYKHMC